MNFILGESQIDKQLLKINGGYGNLFVLNNQLEANHASKIEALDIYIQNSYSKVCLLTDFNRSNFDM